MSNNIDSPLGSNLLLPTHRCRLNTLIVNLCICTLQGNSTLHLFLAAVPHQRRAQTSPLAGQEQGQEGGQAVSQRGHQHTGV